MREYFRQQLMAVVRNQGEIVAYMTEDQVELMFDIGREMGFKSEVACVHVASRLVVHCAEHETWGDFDLDISIKPVNGFIEVKVKYWDKRHPEYIDHIYELQMLDDRCIE